MLLSPQASGEVLCACQVSKVRRLVLQLGISTCKGLMACLCSVVGGARSPECGQ